MIDGKQDINTITIKRACNLLGKEKSWSKSLYNKKLNQEQGYGNDKQEEGERNNVQTR